MDELLLTDREIEKIVVYGHISYMPEYKKVAKAQLEKAREPLKAEGRRELIEWLETGGLYHLEHHTSYWKDHLKKWGLQ